VLESPSVLKLREEGEPWHLTLLTVLGQTDCWIGRMHFCCQMSRLATYSKTKETIVGLVDELALTPCSEFELSVVSGTVTTFTPTADNMRLLLQYAKEVWLFSF